MLLFISLQGNEMPAKTNFMLVKLYAVLVSVEFDSALSYPFNVYALLYLLFLDVLANLIFNRFLCKFYTGQPCPSSSVAF